MNLLDREMRSSDFDMRLFVAIGLVVLLAVFVGVRMLLLRLLPRAPVELTLPFMYVAWLRPRGELLELTTTGHALQGVTLFSTPQRGTILDEYTAASGGAQSGYRAPGYRP
jgi:hypothetical protein